MQRRHCLLLLAACVVLASCGQAFDWREYRSNDGSYKVLFPGKPGKSEREITINGARVKMQMTSIAAHDTLFGVGYVDFSPKAPPGIVAQFRAGLARHLGGKQLTGAETAKDGMLVSDFHGEGTGADGKPASLRGRIVVRQHAGGERLYQLVQIGKPGALQDADSQLFIQSFAPL